MGRNLPSNGQIAMWWMQREQQTRTSPQWGWQDWGEPSCWACNWYREEWEIPDNARGNAHQKITNVWNKTSGHLERCHVVPHERGGSDHPSNLVLMCRKCHELSPDTVRPEVLFKWMKECPGSFLRFHWTVVAECKRAVENVIAEDGVIDPTWDEIEQALKNIDPGFHGSTTSPGTMAAVVYETAAVVNRRTQAEAA